MIAKRPRSNDYINKWVIQQLKGFFALLLYLRPLEGSIYTGEYYSKIRRNYLISPYGGA